MWPLYYSHMHSNVHMYVFQKVTRQVFPFIYFFYLVFLVTQGRSYARLISSTSVSCVSFYSNSNSDSTTLLRDDTLLLWLPKRRDSHVSEIQKREIYHRFHVSKIARLFNSNLRIESGILGMVYWLTLIWKLGYA